MQRNIMMTLIATIFAVFSTATVNSAEAQELVIHESPLFSDTRNDPYGLFACESILDQMSVLIPDNSTVLIGGIMASPEVYFWFRRHGGFVILPALNGGPINDADNRPPLSFYNMAESLLR